MEAKKNDGLIKYDNKSKSFVRQFIILSLHELRPVFTDKRFPRIMWLSFINISCLLFLFNWCYSTKSLGLRSFTYLVVFDSLSLGICALRIWVEQKKPNQQYTFGYERFEVLAIFLSATFSLVSSLFLIKKCIERWFYPTSVLIGHFMPGIILAFICHMMMTYCIKNKGLNLVICAASSSFLQQRLSTLSQNFCTNVPGITTKISPRFNPFVVVGWSGFITLLSTHVLMELYDYNSADSFAAIFIAAFICYIMYPICRYSAKILLQSTPPHIADLLNKCLREASTFDGVLEFRNEHFWLLGYDKIVGSVHVRVRRDANEQIILSHLIGKLSSLVSDLTIQVFKDEWAWSSSTIQILNESFKKFPPSSSSSFQEPSSLKIPTSNEKILTDYTSIPMQNSYTKSATPVTSSLATSSYKPSYGSYASSLLQSMPRPAQNDNYSVDMEQSEKVEPQVRYSQTTSLSRFSRTDSEPLRIPLIDPRFTQTDFSESFKT